MPFGILVKSERPISFWPAKSKGAWSVATVWISPSRRPFHRKGWFHASRRGGDMTYLAPSKPGFSAQVLSSTRYWISVSIATWTPRPRAAMAWSSARLQLRWTM